VRDALRDLSFVLQKYREGASDVAQAEADADLPYLLDNVPKALDRALEGLDRVTVIVRSMKEFAHPDRKEMTAVDLNQAINSTLIIARNEYKYVADVETDLGELPLVMCHGGDVNQVVLNIVVNAAHAISDVVNGTDRRGRITVQTRHDGASVVIRIGDTGGGISADIASRVFDPFFTTKDVGKGTGQGLAIAHAVILEKHGGDLTFETEVGSGTTFIIRLPVDGKQPTDIHGKQPTDIGAAA
jgi:signal transduction histidine kinase